jgi:hypothetical protein
MKQIKEHLLPIILIVLGILDQTTDLLVDLIEQMGLPAYFGTILKILVITLGAVKLYLSQPNKFKND